MKTLKLSCWKEKLAGRVRCQSITLAPIKNKTSFKLLYLIMNSHTFYEMARIQDSDSLLGCQLKINNDTIDDQQPPEVDDPVEELQRIKASVIRTNKQELSFQRGSNQ